LLTAFVEETHEIDKPLVNEALKELSFEEPDLPSPAFEHEETVSPTVQGAPPLDDRLARIEKKYAKLNADRSEKEAILERLSSQGSILEYLINQQQNQFGQLDDQLKKISAQIDRLRQTLLVDGKRGKDKETPGVKIRKL